MDPSRGSTNSPRSSSVAARRSHALASSRTSKDRSRTPGMPAALYRWCLGLDPGFEHLLGSAFDHVQQSRRFGGVADRGEVDDDGDELVPAAGVAPCVLIHAYSSTPRTWTPSKRVGSAISNWWPVVRTASLTVCQDTPSPAAIRAVDIRSMTTLFSARITACVESFALGAAAAVVSWCQTCPQPEQRGSGGCGRAGSLPASRAGRAPVGAAHCRTAPPDGRRHGTSHQGRPLDRATPRGRDAAVGRPLPSRGHPAGRTSSDQQGRR